MEILRKFGIFVLLTTILTLFNSYSVAFEYAGDHYKYNPLTQENDIYHTSEEDLVGGNTNYIQNTSSPQSGSTFFVSSGTALDFYADSMTVNGYIVLRTSPTEEYHAANKEYVDMSVTSLGQRFYLYDLDDASGYKLTYTTECSTPETYYEKAGLVDNEYIMGWISPPGGAPSKLIAGLYDWYIFKERTAGTKPLRVYWSLWERKADSSEVWIASSNVGNLTTTQIHDRVFLVLGEDYTPTAGSRIVGKIFADVGVTGSAPTIRLYYCGVSDSHWEIPTNTEILSTLYMAIDGSNAASIVSFPMSNIVLGGQLQTWNRSAVEIRALVPIGLGAIVYNADDNFLYFSTGTIAGSWAKIKDGTAP